MCLLWLGSGEWYLQFALFKGTNAIWLLAHRVIFLQVKILRNFWSRDIRCSKMTRWWSNTWLVDPWRKRCNTETKKWKQSSQMPWFCSPFCTQTWCNPFHSLWKDSLVPSRFVWVMHDTLFQRQWHGVPSMTIAAISFYSPPQSCEKLSSTIFLPLYLISICRWHVYFVPAVYEGILIIPFEIEDIFAHVAFMKPLWIQTKDFSVNGKMVVDVYSAQNLYLYILYSLQTQCRFLSR